MTYSGNSNACRGIVRFFRLFSSCSLFFPLFGTRPDRWKIIASVTKSALSALSIFCPCVIDDKPSSLFADLILETGALRDRSGKSFGAARSTGRSGKLSHFFPDFSHKKFTIFLHFFRFLPKIWLTQGENIWYNS